MNTVAVTSLRSEYCGVVQYLLSVCLPVLYVGPARFCVCEAIFTSTLKRDLNQVTRHVKSFRITHEIE